MDEVGVEPTKVARPAGLQSACDTVRIPSICEVPRRAHIFLDQRLIPQLFAVINGHCLETLARQESNLRTYG